MRRPRESRRGLAFVRHQLHVNHIQNFPKFAPHAEKPAGFRESKACMQGDAALLVRGDGRNDRPEPGGTGAPDQFLQNKPPQSPALVLMADIHRVFHRAREGLAFVKRRETAPRRNAPAGFRHHHRMLWPAPGKPCPAALLCRGHDLIGTRGGQNIMIVDGIDRREVGGGGIAQEDSGSHGKRQSSPESAPVKPGNRTEYRNDFGFAARLPWR